MKKIIKKILGISLFILAIFTIKSYGASDFTYTLDTNGNATITAYKGTESNLTIPSTIEGHPVTTIGSHAFDESRNTTNGHTIKNVIISEGIKRIELLAFAKCTNLESVKLPESLTFLDMQTFLECSNLKSINIPSQLDKIANSTFQETSLTEISIPENVKTIENRAFGICTSLKKVKVYSRDITYDAGAFEHSSSDLVLYGYEGSTTQSYAEQSGLEFKLLTDGDEGSDDIPVTDISLNKSSLNLYVSDSETLTATILPNNATDKALIWTSSNPDVATVENGKVEAKKVGATTITVSSADGTKKATCSVSVFKREEDSGNIPVIAISLNKSLLSLYIGESETLTATILPNTATDKTLIWTSSNPDVATVENGKVEAKKIGATTITVSSADGTKKATCSVSVFKREEDSGNIPVTAVSLNKSSLSLYIGESETLTATISPNNATDKTLIWTSSNSEVATVENGKVEAKKVGATTITVSSADGRKKASCSVSVVTKTNSEKEDNTVASGNLPQTGATYLGLVLFVFVIGIAVISYKKYKEMKNI